VLLTRKIKTEKIDDKEIISKLEKIGSNCVNLLAGPYRCDLTYRDFSDCAIPYAYFYKRDLTGCNFTRTSMKDSIITDAILDSCCFMESDIRNIEYSRYPDFLGHNN
jgi:uncharacterized protein YjbI with pentapeptide repeats